ncbi:AraC family transcriptional regulator [Puteibacter caeruleilacunae]|nr:AraC family transcriptional regulator [Puteibacter caeruleilacunae]
MYPFSRHHKSRIFITLKIELFFLVFAQFRHYLRIFTKSHLHTLLLLNTVSKQNIEHLIKFELKNIAHSRFPEDSKYPYVISPFSRIYLITEGKGWLLIDGQKIITEPGYLYLVPSFTPCSYFFEKNLDHIYIHFSARLLNGLNIYNTYKTHIQVKLEGMEELLLKRLLTLNPDLKLLTLDPDIYQKKEWLNKSKPEQSISHQLETRAILELLLARFISTEQDSSSSSVNFYHLNEILIYIQDNLREDIQIGTLAKMAYLSTDHFTRIFKKAVSIPPGEYIITKRIEKAQYLLLSTEKPIKQIFEECGFKSMPYFSRLFKKYTSLTPKEYRKMRG